MNKQQLAAKIWESANKMRSKIEANGGGKGLFVTTARRSQGLG